jgi:hypothetical protein
VELGEEPDEAVTSRVKVAVLLRQAAGVTADDWAMESDQGRREAVHAEGLRRLVGAAGWNLDDWIALDEFTRDRSDVLLAGARQLGISTDWKGWT